MYYKNLTMGLSFLFMTFILLVADIISVFLFDFNRGLDVAVLILLSILTLFTILFSLLSQDYSILYRVKINQTGITLMFWKKIKQKYFWEDFINIERGSLLRGGHEFIFSLKKTRKTLQIEDRRKIRKAIVNNCTNPKIVQYILKFTTS